MFRTPSPKLARISAKGRTGGMRALVQQVAKQKKTGKRFGRRLCIGFLGIKSNNKMVACHAL